ncbi:purine or other phosphorylase family 1 [Thermovibrio ammonificans HB-1]|uniref:Probable 6-oxopurine nucleoside phosphorylase n=1 Tax=Thermovibrio ammonificans (strain DSM 15698 / JCM 12110 / HB-1) TaxID=648996 RepID=E8T4D3_THEA1|nr:MTAP family purine nucleoside phosphorylase [Thermovibrio ammonificans]ADU96268.1 purine or other phosphorylase family 1 [Thermovibrio ammonificans HB-1]
MGKVLVIGGSGAYTLEKGEFGEVVGVKRVETPFGLSNPIYTIKHPNGFEYLFLSRHGERDYTKTAPFVNYRANIYGAKELGAERVIAWTGPGSLKRDLKPGEFVVPHDILDFTKGRKTTFFENGGLGFVRQSPVFCPQVRECLLESLKELKETVHDGGVYCCTEGPRLETPAEIRAMERLGGELVGMTLVPEVFLAKELEMCYGAVCYVTNFAEGVKEAAFKEGELFEGMVSGEEMERVNQAVRRFPEVVKLCVEKLYRLERTCHCPKLMERYRRKGRIGTDWRQWILEEFDYQ